MTARTVRLKLNYNLDPSDSETLIEAVKSNAFNIEFGIFQDSIPYDLSGLTSVTMVIRPARGTATNLAAITLPVASLTALPNSVRWNRGTMQHGIFEWTTAQMNQTVTGDYDDYWWSCYALLTTNEEVTLGNGIFRIYESNIANGGVPPVNPGATITADEADARYVRFDTATSLTGGQQTQARENIDADNAANLTSGIIPDARMPNLTGDITTVEGAVATTLATVNSNVGSFGSATQVSAITVNAKGLVTAASAITVTPAESSLTFTDITTNNATSLKHGFLPKLSGSASDVLKGDGTWAAASAGSGSVTSVAMSVPSILTVSGSPITTSGTLAVTLATQAANLVFAGPATGVDATPTFRSLVAADIPSLSSTYLTVANPTATGEFNLSESGTFNSWQFTPGSRYFRFIEGGGGFGMQFNIPILTADREIFWPDAAGTVALSASGNIALSAAGNITFTGTLPVANGGTGITALGTGVATWLGTPTIANLNSAVSDADLAILAANTFTALQTITQASANAGVLASTGYSLTGSNATSMVDLAGTWNTSGAPTAIKLNITRTLAASTSKLLDLQQGGTTAFGVEVNSTGNAKAYFGIRGANIDTTSDYATTLNGYFGMVIQQNSGGVNCIGTPASIGNNADVLLTRKAAATLQLGTDAEGVTNQTLTAASRITSDGVGANLTLDAGNGRGAASGSLIFRTAPAAATGVAGTYADRLTIDSTGLVTVAGNLDVNGTTLYIGAGSLIDYGFGQIGIGNHYLAAGGAFLYSLARISSGALGGGTYVDMTYGDANHQLHLHSGSTTANQLAVYNTYTSSTSYERGVFDWQTTANTLRIGTEKGSSGGTARGLDIVTSGTARVSISSSGTITLADAVDMAFNTTTGTKIGTATGQKLGFWNATPVVQQILATGGGATVDNVITFLQTVGLCKQS